MSRYFAIVIFIVALSSCQRDNDTFNFTNSKDCSSSINAYDLKDVLLGSSIYLDIDEDRLILLDMKSRDELIKVFNLNTGDYLGSFAKVGPGPMEIGGPDPLCLKHSSDTSRAKILMIDHAQHKIMSYDIDSALNNDEYAPYRLLKISHSNFPSRMKFIADTFSLAEMIYMNPAEDGFSKTPGIFNLITGEMTPFLKSNNMHMKQFSFDADEKLDLFIIGGYVNDVLLLYDFNGNLKRTIKGPNYKNKPDKNSVYYSKIELSNEHIFAVRSGSKISENALGSKIIIFDTSGNYIADLELGKTIRDIKYDDISRKLFVSLIDDIQIATIDITELLSI